MHFIDTHTHLYSEEFNTDIEKVIENALNNKIERFYIPNVDKSTVQPMLDLKEKFPEHIFPMIGIHPCSIKEDYENELSAVENELENRLSQYVAIGEIGMDLYWDKTFIKEQEIALRKQIEWAKKYKLPIILHCRDAFEELFEIVESENSEDLKGIFHCFTGDDNDAARIEKLGGFKIGIGGVVTFKNSSLKDILKKIGIQNIVLETDAPYLAPVPFRGKRNESAYVLNIAQFIADYLSIPLEKIADITNRNALEIFGD